MKSTSVATVFVAVAAGVTAQNSSSTTYITKYEYYNSCDSTSAIPTVTGTDILTYCSICAARGMTTFEGGSFTIYETVLPAQCSTGGIEDKTYTVTEPCPSAGLDRSAGYVPQGFTTTTVPCGCAENTPVPILAPVPALASATALPTVSVTPAPAPAGAPAGAPAKNAAGAPAAAAAPTSPAAAPGAPAVSAGSAGGAPAAAPAAGSPGAPAAPASGGSSPAPANAAAAGDAAGAGSPESPAGAPAEAPAAKYPTSPAGAPVASVAPSVAPITNNGTVPFTGAATHRVPCITKVIAGVLITAYAFVQ